ncbi:MAG: hypothetical protein CMH54_13600 [Myxococcales bacterium]|nr:hypothetical protein [Myxococcales bacterium]
MGLVERAKKLVLFLPSTLWNTVRHPLFWIALVWLFGFTYAEKLNNPNERTRVLQARAMLDGKLHIGHTELRGCGLVVKDLYGKNGGSIAYPYVNDVAIGCRGPQDSPDRCTRLKLSAKGPDCIGKIYPAKAPGTSLLGVPALAIADGMGFIPAGIKGERRATWVLRYGGVALFVLLGLWIFWDLLSMVGMQTRERTAVLLATALGTTIYPYGIMFVGHASAGMALLMGIWLVLRARRSSSRKSFLGALGGFLTGTAVLFEYHAAIAAVVIGLWVVLTESDRKRVLLGFIVGALVAFTIHCWLHYTMFGSPLKTGHMSLMSGHNRAGQAGGFMGMDGIHGKSLWLTLFDPYMGLLFMMPWLVVCAPIGFIVLILGRAQGISKGTGRVLAAVPLAYLGFVSTLGNPKVMNGWSIGPRYLVPSMAFLALVAGIGWIETWRRKPLFGAVMAGLAGASILVMVAVTLTFPQPPDGLRNVFGDWSLPLLLQGYGVPSLGSKFGLGALSLAPVLLVSLVLVGRKLVVWEGSRTMSRIVAGGVVLGWLLFLALWNPTPKHVALRERARVVAQTEGYQPTKDCQAVSWWVDGGCSRYRGVAHPFWKALCPDSKTTCR